MIQTWSRIMADEKITQNRLDWISEDLKTSEDSDTILFTGCLPYFDPVFRNLGVECNKIAQAAVKIMNEMGIEPQVSSNERCCGHDQLWEGDKDTFKSLAMINMEDFKKSGAKRIVSTCPECVKTLKVDYPALIGDHGMEVLHITELLSSDDFPLSIADTPKESKVTYHDPCNLGRYLGVFDPPRVVLEAFNFSVEEMDRSQESSLCCGTSCWSSCGQVSKSIQVERLKEAKSTGSNLLVTACIKCQIHFKCAQTDPILGDEIDIDIQDVTTLIAERL
jgi:Fe-S oxidoreductase